MSSLEMYIQVILYRPRSLYLGIYRCIHIFIHLITIKEKETMKVKESKKGYIGGLEEGK